MRVSPLPRILVVGDQGQVAWELRRALAPLGEVFTAGRTSRPVSIDLAHPEGVSALIESLHPDWIINAAAYTMVDKAEQEPDLAMAVNGAAPGLLAQAARRAVARKAR